MRLGEHQLGKHQSGLTLLELLVAVGIFAVMAALAYQTLRNTVLNEQLLLAHSDELQQLQFAIGIFERDLRAAVPRGWRDADGRPVPALSGQGADVLLVRGGRGNPAGLRRAELELVRYQLLDGALQRLYWPALDLASDAPPQRTLLLPDVSAMRIEFLHGGGDWQATWPPLQQGGEPGPLPWPRAARLQLSSNRWGQLERLVELVPGSTPVLVSQQ